MLPSRVLEILMHCWEPEIKFGNAVSEAPALLNAQESQIVVLLTCFKAAFVSKLSPLGGSSELESLLVVDGKRISLKFLNMIS